jgi:hypothetical protein
VSFGALPLTEYRGLRVGAAGVTVRVGCVVEYKFENEALPLRLDLAPYSPEGFDWGYRGRGPQQLAVAILAHASDDPAPVARAAIVQAADLFLADVIARLPDLAWRLRRGLVQDWAAAQCSSERATLAIQMLKEAAI